MSTLALSRPGADGVELYFEDHGSGRPVVLIHGWPLSGRAWEPQLGPLVDAGFRVVTYDRRGFGRSSQPWNGYDYDTFTADLHELMTHLDLRDAALVGFSMGGGEVVRYLSTHGTERVSRAVLAGAVPPYLFKSDDNPDGGLDDPTIASFEDAVRSDRMAFLEDFTTNFFSADGKLGVSEHQRVYARTIGSFASAKGTLDCITAWGRTDFRGDLASVTVPTLVIHGDRDAIVPIEVSGRRSAEAIEGATLHVVKGGPHGLNASHADEFNQVLIDFLKQ